MAWEVRRWGSALHPAQMAVVMMGGQGRQLLTVMATRMATAMTMTLAIS